MAKTTARARANARELGDVPTQLAALEQMNVGQLAEKYRELYGEPTRTRNKEYLRKRLAWRIQELPEGGLQASALERISQLGDDVPERWRMRQAAQVQDLGTVQPTEPRDPRVPPVGTSCAASSTASRTRSRSAARASSTAASASRRSRRWRSTSPARPGTASSSSA